ncbi:MAG: PVC-type heme-binding CxxCH protein, partial [Planctomycetota bacterium]
MAKRTFICCLLILLLRIEAVAADGLGASILPFTPKVTEAGMTISLFADESSLVTPIGIAIDQRDRLFVIESHTHLRPADYEGPKSDRIKIFTDSDSDGRSDPPTVFADGFDAAMNLVFGPDGDLFVVCSHEVWRLRDSDDDGRCDSRTRVLRLETPQRYPHSCLLSIAIGPDQKLYVGRGNVGGRPHRLIGTDGSDVGGYTDGGDVSVSDLDGKNLRRFATGFWNPFDLRFDAAGNLLLVDNDPDARGPNRLLHVVDGGDYGYRTLYGKSGKHPLQGWDGSLPGTLPFVAGTGEAPSGLLPCNDRGLVPQENRTILATIWNENSIERFDLQARGVSFSAQRSVLVQGDKDFRPVGIVADRRGTIYVSDWVDVAYPNHGRGRIWCLKRNGDADNSRPDRVVVDAAERNANPYQRLNDWLHTDDYWEQCDSPDPFVRHALAQRLAATSDAGELLKRLANSKSPRRRLTCLLAHQIAGQISEKRLEAWLADPDQDIFVAAAAWIGNRRDLQHRPLLIDALDHPKMNARMFATAIAAIECLDASFVRAVKEQRGASSDKNKRNPPLELLRKITWDDSRSGVIRGLALKQIPNEALSGERNRLLELIAPARPNSIEAQKLQCLAM